MEWLSLDDILNLEIPPREFITTGTKLDKITGGFVKGEIHLICGSPKNGKSFALLHLAINCSIEGYNVAYLSLENTADDDYERIYDACDSYSEHITQMPSFHYLNLRGTTASYKKEMLFKTILNNDKDILFIDGSEYLIEGKNGVEINLNGQKLMEEILTKMKNSKKNSPLIMSWQNNRDAVVTNFEDTTIANLSGSMAMSRQSYSMWLIKKGFDKKKRYWKMKLLEARQNYNPEDCTFSVINEEGKFNLR